MDLECLGQRILVVQSGTSTKALAEMGGIAWPNVIRVERLVAVALASCESSTAYRARGKL